jgi:hypothetical protein
MSHRQDEALRVMKAATAISPGQLNSLEPPYVDALAVAPPTSGDAQDAWMAFWDEALEPIGNYNDRAYSWLASKGHTQGDLASRWKAYWESL